MAQPTEYVRVFDFTDFSTDYPTTPQPGVQLDAEYDAIKETLDEILTNLALIQRDDGQLANDSVGRDQLKEEVVMGVNTPESWATATAYTVRDSVMKEGVWYWCAIAHTSGVFATDLGAGKWEEILEFNSFLSGSIQDAEDAATAAAASASAAATSATNAATSATNAAASAATASATNNLYLDTDGTSPTIAPSANNSATDSLAVGNGAVVAAAGLRGVAIGKSYVSGVDAIAIQITDNTSSYGAQGLSSIAMGALAKATGEGAIALGTAATATGDASLVIGGTTNTAAGDLSTIIGSALCTIDANSEATAIIAATSSDITYADNSVILAGEGDISGVSGNACLNCVLIAQSGSEILAGCGNSAHIATSGNSQGTDSELIFIAGGGVNVVGNDNGAVTLLGTTLETGNNLSLIHI